MNTFQQYANQRHANAREARQTMRRDQEGVFLLEALIAILIFAVGILGIVALGATAVATQSDAQYRTEAARVADNIVSAIWTQVDRGSFGGTQPTDAKSRQDLLAPSLSVFSHQASGASASCDFSGAATTDPIVAALIANVTSTIGPRPSGLPGTTPNRVQILLEPVNVVAPVNAVLVTVCWQAPNDSAPRRHFVRTVLS